MSFVEVSSIVQLDSILIIKAIILRANLECFKLSDAREIIVLCGSFQHNDDNESVCIITFDILDAEGYVAACCWLRPER